MICWLPTRYDISHTLTNIHIQTDSHAAAHCSLKTVFIHTVGWVFSGLWLQNTENMGHQKIILHRGLGIFLLSTVCLYLSSRNTALYWHIFKYVQTMRIWCSPTNADSIGTGLFVDIQSTICHLACLAGKWIKWIKMRTNKHSKSQWRLLCSSRFHHQDHYGEAEASSAVTTVSWLSAWLVW